jgi:hypothetical protein
MRHSKLIYILMFSSILKLFGCSDKNSDKKPIDSNGAMQEFRQNIEANRILTKQMLDTTADEKLEDKIIANIDSKQDQNLSNDKDVLPTLSKERQAIYYIYLVEMEVNNGGFDQFYLNKFINNDGSYMFDKTAEAFKLIGATKFADLVEKANQLFKANEKEFADKEGLFEKVDQEFYDTYKQENLFDLRTKFIRNNIDSFVDK